MGRIDHYASKIRRAVLLFTSVGLLAALLMATTGCQDEIPATPLPTAAPASSPSPPDVDRRVEHAVEKPASKGTLKMSAPTLDEITVRRGRQPGLVVLQWSLPKEDMKKAGAQGFAIFRGQPDGPLTEMLYKLPPQMGKESDDQKTLTFSYGDSEAGTTSRHYAVAYLDRGLKPGHLSASVTIAKLGDAIKPPDVEAEIAEEGVLIRWKDDNEAGTFAGFVVRRYIEDEESVALNAEPLPTEQRSYVDNITAKESGKIAIYTVYVDSGDERQGAFSSPIRIQLP
ncbi:MAG: hypothetical protein FWE88_08765 [Phycisphaerae bacterium]|nr:hypothetical protein [Phycisphaerae bacterium]